MTKFKRSTKYKVIPGLSLTGKELQERVRNRSILINQDGKAYSQLAEIDRAIRSSRVENHRKWLTERGKVEALGKVIELDKAKTMKAALEAKVKAEVAKEVNAVKQGTTDGNAK